VNTTPFDVKPVFAVPAKIIPTLGQVSEIRYALSQMASVSIAIYTLPDVGVPILVRTLFTSETQAPGEHTIFWDGRNDNGRIVSSAAYMYEIIAIDNGNTNIRRRGSIRVAF
jgi:flagellar hook assembly protein FlgD